MPTAVPARPSLATRETLLWRINAPEPRTREVAWDEFGRLYAPVIAGFARNLGARGQDIDDVIQDVMLGFYTAAPEFEYDPSKGRFRGYLKVCTFRALRRRAAQDQRFPAIDPRRLDEQAAELDSAWNELWEEQLLKRALSDVRERRRESATFRAFERTVLDGARPADVATELGLSLDAVYKARQRLMAEVRQRLGELHDDEP